MPEYLLSSSIDPIEKGQVFEAGEPLPRHVTVQQWFTVASERAFHNGLKNLAAQHTPFEITGLKTAEFGPENNIPVRLVKGLGVLALHARTLELITRFGGTHRNPEWAGDGYNPHVAFVDGRALEEDEAVTLRTIELIKREDELRTVISVLGLSKAGRE